MSFSTSDVCLHLVDRLREHGIEPRCSSHQRYNGDCRHCNGRLLDVVDNLLINLLLSLPSKVAGDASGRMA